MFSAKTQDLAKHFMEVQELLKRSIEEDLKEVRGTLAEESRLHVWVDDTGVCGEPVSIEAAQRAFGVPTTVDDDASPKYHILEYKVNDVPCVTLIRKQKEANNE